VGETGEDETAGRRSSKLQAVARLIQPVHRAAGRQPGELKQCLLMRRNRS
jgi:hypothetical protein